MTRLSKTKKYMITGGCGFIGSCFVRKAAILGAEILVIDKITYAANEASIASELKSDKVNILREDICDQSKMYNVMKQFRPDTVVHFAAESHVDNSIDAPENFIQSNIVGTYSLLMAALNHWKLDCQRGQSQFKFHHISTDEVYGDLPLEDSSDIQLLGVQKFSEITPYMPSSPYSASKAASDHLVRAWHRTYGLPITISNCSNNYGPFQNVEKLIPKTILNAINMKKIGIYGDGGNVRDWLFVEDHIEALILILDKGQIGESYNVGSRSEFRNIDLTRLICEKLEQFYPIAHNPKNLAQLVSYVDLIELVPDRPGHDRRYAIDPSKIERELGWRPLTGIEEGVEVTIEHFMSEICIP